MTEEPIKIKADTYVIVAKRENKEEIKGLVQKHRQKEFSFGELVKKIREAGGDIIFGELQVETDKGKLETISDLQKQFNSGELMIEDFQRKVAEEGGKAEFWNYETGRNPEYKRGESQLGFPYNPYFHIKGKYFQGVIKIAIRKAIDFAHSGILKQFDKDGYVFDDERLKAIDEYCRGYIAKNFPDPYKVDFMTKVIDIILFLMKVDIFYRARFLDMIKNLPRNHELTKEEEENIKRVLK